MTLTFVTTATAPAGSPLHVTVYSMGVPVDPTVSPVSWSGLPASITVVPDATGYVFTSTAVIAATVQAHLGLALGSLFVNFTAPPLQFTSP
jgi:hypothetical protein